MSKDYDKGYDDGYEKGDNVTENFIIITLLIGVAIGLLFGIIIGMGYNAEDELGQAICEQEYDMDFDSYYDGELFCQEKEIKEEYDGIKVVINNEGS